MERDFLMKGLEGLSPIGQSRGEMSPVPAEAARNTRNLAGNLAETDHSLTPPSHRGIILMDAGKVNDAMPAKMKALG